jgi:hypothetical protein
MAGSPVAKPRREAALQPDGVTDEQRRKALARGDEGAAAHAASRRSPCYANKFKISF